MMNGILLSCYCILNEWIDSIASTPYNFFVSEFHVIVVCGDIKFEVFRCVPTLEGGVIFIVIHDIGVKKIIVLYVYDINYNF